MNVEAMNDEQAARSPSGGTNSRTSGTTRRPTPVASNCSGTRPANAAARRRDGDELVGFFNFVPAGDEVRIGLGMRPDLTGRGLAQPFIEAGLDYARREWRPRQFRLWVARWNERALRAYRRAGFREVPPAEESRFVEMERPA